MSATAVKSGSMIRVAVPVDPSDGRPIGQKLNRVSTVVKVGEDGKIHENEGWVLASRMGIDWESIPAEGGAAEPDPGAGPGSGVEVPRERRKPGRKPGGKKLVTVDGPVEPEEIDPRQRTLPVVDSGMPLEMWDLLASLGNDLRLAATSTDHQGVISAIRTLRLLAVGTRLERKLLEGCPDAHP